MTELDGETVLNSRLTSTLLGYPANARLLIVNADDFGMCQAVNAAIFRTLTEGLVCSTSLMVPCPWALHAMNLLREHPEIAFGVHLTVICDTVNYRWGPVTPRARVPTLIDKAGYFYSLERIPEFLAQVRLKELELEFRAQIEAVLAAGLHPTHLDWHCLHGGGSAEAFEMTLSLAGEYGLAVRVAGQPFVERARREGLPTLDHDLMDSFRMDTVNKSARYIQMLRELPTGLSEWAVHPGLENEELGTIQPGGARVRQTDFEFWMSPEARDVVREQGIVLLNYRPLQTLAQGG